MMKKISIFIMSVATIVCAKNVCAQTDIDGIMMEKKRFVRGTYVRLQ